MANSQNTHWTTDEHLLSQYVLGRLDASHASELDNHLRQCAPCRDAVEAEQQLAAGVRRAGRDALKQRLTKRIEQQGTGTNWYRVAAVAAAIVVLLTIGINNKWFFSGETKVADSRLKSDSIAPKTEVIPQPPSPGQQSPEKTQLADVSKPSSVAERDLAESKGAGAGGSELDRKKGEAEGGKRDVMNVPVPDNSGNILSKKDQVMAEPNAEGIWVEGTVVSGEENVRAAGKAMDKTSEDLREMAPKGKKEPTALMSFAARSRAQQSDGPPVVVTQHPISDLPKSQMRRKQSLSQVQTLFCSDSGGLTMSLYSDSLFTRNDLSEARLQTIRKDSVVLLLGNQRIGYRLPPVLPDQLAKQLKQAP
ncbi:MAG: anti-sigma factor [Ignavibacteriales bacterium]|nr:anti-sigma factor [Ignavibacteriales bacterium]